MLAGIELDKEAFLGHTFFGAAFMGSGFSTVFDSGGFGDSADEGNAEMDAVMFSGEVGDITVVGSVVFS